MEGEVSFQRLYRKSTNMLRNGFPKMAWDLLEELPEKIVEPEEVAALRLLRGYALKRMDDLPGARLEVEESLNIHETYSGWYNKACYIALAHSKGLDWG